MDVNFERQIIIGLVTNTPYLTQLKSEWNPEYLESSTASTIARWCWEHFDKYERAPKRKIERIYMKKLKKLDEDLAEELQHDILPELSKEFEAKDFDLEYSLTETRAYFQQRQLTILSENIVALIEKDKVEEAQALFDKTIIITDIEDDSLDLSDPKAIAKLERAFNEEYQNVIYFPGALGQFWNRQLARGGFVSLLAPEKRGKTFWLLEFMMRAYKQKKKVAFFQAGDMTEPQQLIRTAIYLARRSNQAEYCGIQYIPVRDCVYNQTQECDKRDRERNPDALFTNTAEAVRKETTLMDLKEAMYPKYKTCRDCATWKTKPIGAVYLKKIDLGGEALEFYEAKKEYENFFGKAKRKIKLSTHVNGTLSIRKMRAILEVWKRVEGFVPDLIIVDYADLLVSDTNNKDERHNINSVWKGLRALSQEYNALVIAPTQADADSYEKDLLTLKNFSEDKRKMAHVTAMYGLNQDKEGREKELGIMRVNKIVVREGGFHNTHLVHVLNRLEIGRPYLGSYW